MPPMLELPPKHVTKFLLREGVLETLLVIKKHIHDDLNSFHCTPSFYVFFFFVKYDKCVKVSVTFTK